MCGVVISEGQLPGEVECLEIQNLLTTPGLCLDERPVGGLPGSEEQPAVVREGGLEEEAWDFLTLSDPLTQLVILHPHACSHAVLSFQSAPFFPA